MSSYQITKLRGCNVRHSDSSQRYCVVYLKADKRGNLKSARQKRKEKNYAEKKKNCDYADEYQLNLRRSSFGICTNIRSLCCAPEINTILYVNYISYLLETNIK